ATKPSEGTRPAAKRVPGLAPLVQIGSFASVIDGRNRGLLERDVLPPYLRGRRWFAQKDERRVQVAVTAALCFNLGGRDRCWLIAEARGRTTVAYSLPLID